MGNYQILHTNLRNTQKMTGLFITQPLSQRGARPENCGMKIGPVIRKLRKEKGATLEQIALIAGTDPGNLSKVERDLQQLTPDMLENVAKALEMPISSLYLIAEQTSAQHIVSGSKKEMAKEVRRLEDFVTRFMLLTPEHQLMVNEFIAVMLKSQGKGD